MRGQEVHIEFLWENLFKGGHFEDKDFRIHSYIEREIGNLVVRVGDGLQWPTKLRGLL
jgi:hypothetical protein